jgi:hypothetical protein
MTRLDVTAYIITHYAKGNSIRVGGVGQSGIIFDELILRTKELRSRVCLTRFIISTLRSYLSLLLFYSRLWYTRERAFLD